MVEWKKLGEIASYYRGVTYNKKQEVESNSGGIKILRANNITLDNNSLNFDDVKEIDNSVKIRDNQWLYPNDILICSGSGSKEHVGKVAYIDKEIGYAYGGFMGKLVTKSCLNSRYLFHILCGSIFKDYLKVALNSTTINNLNSEIINNFPIPIPSLEEQTRIVGILDTFTSAIDNLKEQIAQRRKQYEYYRDQLLDLEGKPGVEMKTLGEVCEIGDGLHGTPIYNETGDFFFINGNNLGNGKILIKSDTKKVDDTMFSKYGIELDNKTILMSINGTIGNIAVYNGEKIILGKSAAYFKIFKDDVILYRFLYYSLQTTNSNNYYMESLTGTTIKNLGLKALRNYYIPLPPLQKQQRIVSILDTFEASIQNLEAQLKERQKQYEYYRNKLLTFE